MQTRTTIRQILDNSIEKYPEETAFILKEKAGKEVKYNNITYKQLGEELKVLGTAFMKEELTRVAVIGKNSYPWVVSHFAAICSGAISVPLDKGLMQDETESCLQRSEAQILIFDKDHMDQVKIMCQKPEFKNVRFVCMNDTDDMPDKVETLGKYMELGKKYLDKGSKDYDDVVINGDDLAEILFTSGTTSRSKAVMLSNNNVASNIYALNNHIKFYTTDVNMAFLPLHHTFGSTSLLLLLAHGATNVFCDGLKYVQQNFCEYKVSVFIAVPLLVEGIYTKVIKQAKKQGKYEKLKKGVAISSFLMKFGIDIRRKIFKEVLDQFGGNIRLIVSGASALSKEVAKAYNSVGVTLIQGYGLTETSPVVSGENEKNINYGSIGIPMCNLEVKIDNPDDEGTGEIMVKGPSVMVGYYKDPEETAKVLQDGWFRTGDLGYIDPKGIMYIRGRQKNVIVLKNGKNIFPEELEDMISKIPYVSECMVYGEEKGEDLVVSLIVVYDKEALEQFADAPEEEIKAFVWKDIEKINDTLPTYKRIKRLTVTDVPMEKTTTAKIKRYKVLETANKQ